MKRILITGAAGFLGSHLCDRFIAEGYFVIGMDNLITGDLKNIEHFLKIKILNFIIMILQNLFTFLVS
jgi:dTDP-glucose 4,6-dehydratase